MALTREQMIEALLYKAATKIGEGMGGRVPAQLRELFTAYTEDVQGTGLEPTGLLAGWEAEKALVKTHTCMVCRKADGNDLISVDVLGAVKYVHASCTVDMR